MGCDHADALRDPEARVVRVYDERRKALCTGCLARAHKDDVMIGDAAVRNPGLAPIDHVMVALAPSRTLERRDVGATLGFGKGEGRDLLARCDAREIAGLECFGSEEGNRSAAE